MKANQLQLSHSTQEVESLYCWFDMDIIRQLHLLIQLKQCLVTGTTALHQMSVTVIVYEWSVSVLVCKWVELVTSLRMINLGNVETAVTQQGCACLTVGPETENINVFTFSTCFGLYRCTQNILVSIWTWPVCLYVVFRKSHLHIGLGLHQCVCTGACTLQKQCLLCWWEIVSLSKHLEMGLFGN